MDNVLTMKSNRHGLGHSQRWIDKPQKAASGRGMGIHKRNGVYWFNNHKIKDLIAFCRREGLIVAPDSNMELND